MFMGNNRVAIVTGAARGIGFATAQRLAEAGVKVALIDRSPSVIQQAELLQKSGHTAIGIIGDVSTEKSVLEFIKQVVFMSPNLDSAHTRIFEMKDSSNSSFVTGISSNISLENLFIIIDLRGAK
jgi:NAD(P)-dependent dehydrogenase (short-subunit alcohol dehydrogenase family)